ncbi:hypothetical protein HDU96_004018, partial [Phlyctochytrium bullatum]
SRQKRGKSPAPSVASVQSVIGADTVLPRRLRKTTGPFSGHKAYPIVQERIRENQAHHLGVSDSLKRLQGLSAREQLNVFLASAIAEGKAPAHFLQAFIDNTVAANAATLQADTEQRSTAPPTNGAKKPRRSENNQPEELDSPPPPPPPPRTIHGAGVASSGPSQKPPRPSIPTSSKVNRTHEDNGTKAPAPVQVSVPPPASVVSSSSSSPSASSLLGKLTLASLEPADTSAKYRAHLRALVSLDPSFVPPIALGSPEFEELVKDSTRLHNTYRLLRRGPVRKARDILIPRLNRIRDFLKHHELGDEIAPGCEIPPQLNDLDLPRLVALAEVYEDYWLESAGIPLCPTDRASSRPVRGPPPSTDRFYSAETTDAEILPDAPPLAPAREAGPDDADFADASDNLPLGAKAGNFHPSVSRAVGSSFS